MRINFDKKDKTSKRVTFSNASYDALVSWDSSRAVTHQDTYSNVLARLGSGTDNIVNAGTYIATPLDDGGQLLTTLYRYNWVVRNLVEAVPNDIIKKWFKVKTSLPPTELDKLDLTFRQTNLRNRLNEGMRWGRLYGGALAIIIVAGQEDNLDEPLNYDYIMPGSFKGLYVLDRYRCNPEFEMDEDPTSSNFGKPIYYQIYDTNTDLNVRVHHSKVLRFLGRPLPILERQRELQWGSSEVEAVYRELLKRDSASENIASLIFKANLSVYKIPDLDQIFAMNSVQAQQRFWNLIESISTIESNMGVRLLNKDDDVQYLNYSFNGIKDVYEGIMMDLSGACKIPATKLFGRSPAGMNATGESDLQNYYDFIDEVRESQFREHITSILPIVALSTWGKIPEDLDFEFEEMASLNESEKTQIVQQKTSIIVEAFNSNLIPQDVAQKELKALSENYGMFDNITDEMIQQNVGKYAADLQSGGMNDPMAGLFGGDEMGGMGSPTPSTKPPAPEPSAQDSVENKEDQDDVEKYLMQIRNSLLTEGSNIDYSTDGLEFASENQGQSLEEKIAEFERMSKIAKKVQKEYEDVELIMWSYPDQNAIPSNYVAHFNRLKNQFNNTVATLNKLEEDIIALGGNVPLLEAKGELDDVVDDLKEDLETIKYNFNAQRAYNKQQSMHQPLQPVDGGSL